MRKKLASQLTLLIFDYCDVVLSKLFIKTFAILKQHITDRFVLGCPFLMHHCTMYDALKWPSLNIRRQIHWLQRIFKCIHFNYPSYLQQYLVPVISNYQLRHSAQLYFSVPQAKKSVGKRAFMIKAPLDWNNLPSDIRYIASFGMFRHTLSAYFENDCSCKE